MTIEEAEVKPVLTAKQISEKYGSDVAPIYKSIFGELNTESSEILALKSLIGDLDSPIVVEFGVGTGRVLIPLAEALVPDTSPRLVGIDGSSDLLDIARAASERLPIELIESDISAIDLDVPHALGVSSLVFCVCGTISMLPDRESQLRSLQNAAALLTETGLLVIETHSPELIRQALGQGGGSTYVPYPPSNRGLVSFHDIDGDRWTVKEVWIDGDEITRMSETSLLTTVDDLTALAAQAGLEVVETWGSLSGGEYSPDASPMYALVLRRRSKEDSRRP